MVSSLNNENTRLMGMKPVDAIKQTLVEQGFSQPAKEYEEKLLDVGTKVRYYCQAGELESYQYKGERRKRSTDPIWSVDVYKIKDRYVQKHQPILYYLDSGPKRSFVSLLVNFWSKLYSKSFTSDCTIEKGPQIGAPACGTINKVSMHMTLPHFVQSLGMLPQFAQSLGGRSIASLCRFPFNGSIKLLQNLHSIGSMKQHFYVWEPRCGYLHKVKKWSRTPT